MAPKRRRTRVDRQNEEMHRVLQEAVDIIAANNGNVALASETSGIPRSTLWGRKRHAEQLGMVANDRSPSKQDDSRRIRELEEMVENYQKRLDRLNSSKFSLPRPTRTKLKGAFVRVVVPDTHGCVIDQSALSVFLGDLEYLGDQVREIVMLGDHLDCGGFLAQHHTLGYVASTTYTFEDDVDACNKLLDSIQSFCPKAQIHYLEGNHENRIERWCVTQALGQGQDASYLLRLFGVESVLNLEKRGIKHYRQGERYDGVPIPATIQLGKCYFTHGSRTGKHAAASMLQDFGGNVVFGHTHRMDSYTMRTVNEGVIGAWCPGCLCDMQPRWRHTQITGWSHGYGVQFVQPDGTFLHINVPIIDGKSYLLHLAKC